MFGQSKSRLSKALAVTVATSDAASASPSVWLRRRLLKAGSLDEPVDAAERIRADRGRGSHRAGGDEHAAVEDVQVGYVVGRAPAVDDRGPGVVAHSCGTEKVPAP